MAVALPHFAEFDVHSDGAIGIRWKKWLTRFKNLLLALDVDDTKRQRALLPHYAGESVNEIFETLPNTDAGEDEDPFEKAVTALTNYFTPKKNREYEVYVFRKAKQENGKNIFAFHTRLRQLAMNGEFADTDREIKTQIVENCLSHKLRMKALQNPELTLTQLLDAGYPHPGGKTSCPAYGKSCRSCGKQNHYEAVCRSKKLNKKRDIKTQKPRHNVQNFVDENSSSEDSDEDGYAFSVNSTGKERSQPMFNIVIHKTPMTIMADSGASVNVLDEKDYQALSKRPELQTTKVKIHPYKSNKSLKVLGNFNMKCVEDKLYVVQGSGGSLLSWKTSQELGLLKAVHNVNDDSSPTTEKLIKEYDELLHGLGKLKGYQIKLHIDKSVPPVAQPHRRVPFHVRQQLEEQLKRDEELGVIERIEGPTPWVSPIVVAPKPKSPGKVRVCVDMRQTNQAIKWERHVTPTIKEIIGDLNGAKVFSKLDLNQGYNQLDAAEIFQNVIRETLEGIPGALNISDDILVLGKTQSAHDQSLEAVFQRLKERGLTLNKHKCEYGKDKLEFHGYVFSGDGTAPDPKKIDDIVNLQTPTSASEVRSLLGMTNYCSRFIPDYAAKTEPLRKLTRQDQPWEWTSQHDSAVDQLKEALVNAPVTAYFDPTKDTEISVDASPAGLAAILSQVDRKTGTHHIVTYASRPLSETEQRYSQTEREALAVVWACEHLHLYIYGKPVTIYTDHKPLVSIYGNPSSKPPARVERWALRLQPYQLTIRYRKGEETPQITCHATLPNNQPQLAENRRSQKTLTVQEIEEATKADATLQAVSKAIETGNWQEGPKQSDVDSVAYTAWQKVKEELSVGVTAQIILRGTRIAVPRKLQERVVNLAHKGHQGVVKTKSLLRERYGSLASTKSKREPLKMSPLPKAPWSEVSMDFAELPNSEYLLIITDDYSRYPVVETVKSTSANTVIPRVGKMFSEFGIPDVVKTDNGPPFNSREFQSFAQTLGFKHPKITPRWPRANGEVERFVRTIKKEMHRFLRNFRATPHTTTKVPPATALFGRALKTKLSELKKTLQDPAVEGNDRKAKSRMKRYADSKTYVQPSTIQEGDTVFVKRDDSKRKRDTPYRPDSYVVVQKKGSMVTARNNNATITRNSS
ncbi:Transposon Ty3-I Gag-Pol poly, partial [Paramuricea clavata]